jgi:hypothetical protein
MKHVLSEAPALPERLNHGVMPNLRQPSGGACRIGRSGSLPFPLAAGRR